MFKSAKDAAKDMAQQFAADYPVSLQNLAGRKSLDLYHKALVELKTRAEAAQAQHGFGIMSRIVLARNFQSLLAGLNYAGIVQRQATSELASALTFAGKVKKKLD